MKKTRGTRNPETPSLTKRQKPKHPKAPEGLSYRSQHGSSALSRPLLAFPAREARWSLHVGCNNCCRQGSYDMENHRKPLQNTALVAFPQVDTREAEHGCCCFGVFLGNSRFFYGRKMLFWGERLHGFLMFSLWWFHMVPWGVVVVL